MSSIAGYHPCALASILIELEFSRSCVGHASPTSCNPRKPPPTCLPELRRTLLNECCQVIYSQFGLAIHQNDHQARRRFIEWAQNEIAVAHDFHRRVLFSDEAHFCLNGYVNKQNCRIWSEANPQVYVETALHPEKTDCLVRFMG
ncbi:hypothetical protein TNCV_1223291 [Trichonephila clavipes]|nr:hypothetical protein TNCV_1223291 [Trichonephila clavipes]